MGGGAGQPAGRCTLFANVVFLKGKLTAPVGTGTHHTSSNEIQPAEQNTGNPLEVGGKEGDGAPCRGLLRRGCSRARCLRSEHCSLPNGLWSIPATPAAPSSTKIVVAILRPFAELMTGPGSNVPSWNARSPSTGDPEGECHISLRVRLSPDTHARAFSLEEFRCHGAKPEPQP